VPDIVSDIRRLWQHQGPRALLARGALGGLVANLVGAALGYGLHVLLARIMGPSHYGVFAYVPSWLDLLQMVGLFGLGPTIVRFAAAYRAQQRLGAIRGLLRFADRTALGASVLGAVGLVGVLLLLPPDALARIAEDPDDLARAFWIGAAILPVLVLSKLRTETIRGFGGATLSLTLEGVVRPALMLLLLLVTVVAVDGPITGSIALGLYGASLLGHYLLAEWLVRSRRPSGVSSVAPEYETRLWLDMALPTMFIMGTRILLGSTDRILVGTLLGTEQAGVYGAALRTSQLVTFGLTAVNAALAPLASSLHAAGDHRQLQRVLTLAAQGVFAWSLLGGIGLLVLGARILGWFGPGFEAGYGPLAVLAVGQAVNAGCGSVALVLQMTGHQRRVARIFAATAVLNVALDLALIPRLGMVGAAIGTGISMIDWNLALLVLVHRVLGLNPSVFGRRGDGRGAP
jgi:O-antigen/teichoic acid export membrane protein